MLIFIICVSFIILQKKEKKMLEKEKVGMDLDLPNVCRYSLNP
jgi:cbb3-type cytochrome oxidase subunit 3